MLAYDDAPAAIAFLRDTFGFEERFRLATAEGGIGHAEMALMGNVVMLATTWKEGGLASPRELPAMPCQLYCVGDDVDAHFEHARAAGAVVVAEPQDQPYGSRIYRALDLERHRWIFASPLADSK
ncbi:MAG: VOC family protein [Acidobacteriota bacterium]|nr:VOC family protein [Acidobacteriota bacterium]